MDLLERCQKWHENDEYQKIVEALEAIPAVGNEPPRWIWSWRGPITIWPTPAGRKAAVCCAMLSR